MKRRRRPLSERKVARYAYQLCRALDHVHRSGIFHRDVKPENILIKQDVLKLGDFGSCRSVYAEQPHTEYISTRWYRAPECLLTDGCYSYKMDLWSAGCVLYEMARAAEKQAPGSHRDAGFPECPGAEDPPCGNWQASKESRKQQWPLKQQEDWPGRPAPAARTELPRLKLSGVISLPSPRLALPPVFGVRGRGAAPRLRPLECGDANQKTDPQPAAQKEVKADQKRRRLPAAHRRGGGC
ncbi:MOK protein kinase [Phyllostomus discolor]|uniref:MOK protein kinase n=1 Tax=Phyllostomus discolor TaxID=89673 RepID=A0A834BNW9_9CHIR|nr:MOK protein kinase [Phyllostomus discolor]